MNDADMQPQPQRQDRRADAGDAGGARRVVVSNVFADHNRGGAAITASTLGAVREAAPDAQLTLVMTSTSLDGSDHSLRHTLAAYPNVTVVGTPFVTSGRAGPAVALVRSLWALLAPGSQRAPALRAVRDADLVVSKGGHVFIEREGWGGVLGLWFTTFALTYAARVGVPTVAFATSVGPFHTWPSRLVNRAVLRRTSVVLARDPRSAKVARRLVGGRRRVVEVPDSVFSMPSPRRDEVARQERRFGLEGSRYGIFTVRAKGDTRQRQELIGSLAGAAERLLHREELDHVVVVVQVHGRGVSDLADSQRFAQLVDDDRVRLIEDDLAPAELIALYAHARFVVGCRMHSTIFATVAGTPSIGIALSGEKVLGTFEQLGFEDRVIEQRDVETSDLVDRLQHLLAHERQERHRTLAAASAARSRTVVAVAELRRLLEPRERRRRRTPALVRHGGGRP